MGPLTSSYVLCGSREANEGKLFELSPPAAYVVVGIPTCSSPLLKNPKVTFGCCLDALVTKVAGV